MSRLKLILSKISIEITLLVFLLLHIYVFFLSDLIKNLEIYLFLIPIIVVVYALLAYKIINTDGIPIKLIIPTSVIIAILYLGMKTNLSSDMYRYIWDGWLLKSGYNPYLYRPIDEAMAIFRQNTDLYSRMGWTNQYTVYPPVAQIIFFISYIVYSSFGYVGAKIILSLPVLGLAYYLYRHYSSKVFSLFILNPVILFECFYGGHIDIWAVLFTILAIHYYHKQSNIKSALMISLGILTKIFPIIFVPIFFIDLVRKKQAKIAITYITIIGITITIFYLPFIQHSLFPITRYQSWVGDNEFNSSVFYSLLNLSKLFSDTTTVTVSRICGLLFAISSIVLWKKGYSLNIMVGTMILYLLFSPVVYPWYTLLFIPLLLINSSKQKDYYEYFILIVLQGILSLTYVDQLWGWMEEPKNQLLHAISTVLYAVLFIMIVRYLRHKRLNKSL